MNHCRSAGILFFVILTLCNSANGADAPDEQVSEWCHTGVKLTVSGGNNPIFDWPADCAVHQLIVEDDWTKGSCHCGQTGYQMAAVNVRCLQGVKFSSLPVKHFDGRAL
jgi:hypothetical protein